MSGSATVSGFAGVRSRYGGLLARIVATVLCSVGVTPVVLVVRSTYSTVSGRFGSPRDGRCSGYGTAGGGRTVSTTGGLFLLSSRNAWSMPPERCTSSALPSWLTCSTPSAGRHPASTTVVTGSAGGPAEGSVHSPS